MGLFSNNKKLCPICGNPTPRLLATKVEDMPICKECDSKVDLPDGVINRMSLNDFRQYMSFYDENQALRDTFTETKRFDFGFLAGALVLDTTHDLIRLKNNNNALVFEMSAIKAFRITEDNCPIFEGGQDGLRCYQSDVPARISAMAPQITQYLMQKREFERMEQMERMMERHQDDRDGPPPHQMYHSSPIFDIPEPFEHFYVELNMEHPYWSNFRGKIDAPTFNSSFPSADSYMNDYQRRVNDLHALAVSLMRGINPAAQEVYNNGNAVQTSAQTQPSGNAIEDIQKLKTLLDLGILTEEEFTAKKRQLLGL